MAKEKGKNRIKAMVATDKNIDLNDKYHEILLAVTEQVIQAEGTLHLIDKLVKEKKLIYPDMIVEIQNLIKDYKEV